MKILLYGTGGEKVRFRYENDFGAYAGSSCSVRRRSFTIWSAVTGRRLPKASVNLSKHYMSAKPCQACKGQRLKPESLAVTIGGKISPM